MPSGLAGELREALRGPATAQPHRIELPEEVATLRRRPPGTVPRSGDNGRIDAAWLGFARLLRLRPVTARPSASEAVDVGLVASQPSKTREPPADRAGADDSAGRELAVRLQPPDGAGREAENSREVAAQDDERGELVTPRPPAARRRGHRLVSRRRRKPKTGLNTLGADAKMRPAVHHDHKGQVRLHDRAERIVEPMDRRDRASDNAVPSSRDRARGGGLGTRASGR